MLARLIGIIAFAAAAAASAQPAPPVRTGGIGEEERRALESDARYNLKLVAANRAGQYVSDVGVAAARMAGPWLLADLPPGRYRVVAVYQGARQSRDVVVGRGGRQDIVMQWDARGLR